MAEYTSIEIRGIFRSPRHFSLWFLMQESGILRQVGIEKIHFDYCESSSGAEAALFAGSIDFISGNHISPYALIAQGYPIVSLASPDNIMRARLVSREPVASLAEVKGWRIGDVPVTGPDGGYNHTRGNHMLYLSREKIGPSEVEWIDLKPTASGDYAELQLRAMQAGSVDATFVRSTAEYQKHGFHVFTPPSLPMVSGPTITTTLTKLKEVDRLGERLVKAMVLGIHFAKTQREKTDAILQSLNQRFPQWGGVRAEKLARMPAKPYPDVAGIANAYELACMHYPEARTMDPIALWDIHYLRDLDGSGFIDELYRNWQGARHEAGRINA
ncbi:MAG: ABC transporter substrate-binding protein [Burkholderiales bacterium]|nr:ABC transporter substrate-binding protein [Burkholderiales bacterium]